LRTGDSGFAVVRSITNTGAVIIFGVRSYVRLLAMINLICRNCGNPAAHRVVQTTRKFTLFFVPLFPVSKSRSMTCTFCGLGTRLSREQADQLVAGAQGGPAPTAAAPVPPHAPQG
jgi:hypothetical protein